MKRTSIASIRRRSTRLIGRLFARLPESWKSRIYRRAIDLAPAILPSLELKLAETEAELEACYALLHDAYVGCGFMRPHPSGLRVTPYHALPTTSTLCAKVDGQVVGTLSIVRDGVFGFPMQSAFDIAEVRAKGGRIAEISALAVHPRFRKTGGSILFPLMKFMYEYCTRYFDTRHLLIAVNPAHIGMYESVLFFRRLGAQTVDRYDFVNGAPAIGATLDLHEAPRVFERAYGGRTGKRDLHRYFVRTRLPAIRFPIRDWHVSNDPVLTPALMDHFFNRRTGTFAALDERRVSLLHSIYRGTQWAGYLPPLPAGEDPARLRHRPRFSLRCPAALETRSNAGPVMATILEISGSGFRASTEQALAIGARVAVDAELGAGRQSQVIAEVVRLAGGAHEQVYGFRILQSDAVWEHCVDWLEGASPAAQPIAPTPRRTGLATPTPGADTMLEPMADVRPTVAVETRRTPGLSAGVAEPVWADAA